MLKILTIASFLFIGMFTSPIERFVGDEWTFVPFSYELQSTSLQWQDNVQYSIDSYEFQNSDTQLHRAISVQ